VPGVEALPMRFFIPCKLGLKRPAYVHYSFFTINIRQESKINYCAIYTRLPRWIS